MTSSFPIFTHYWDHNSYHYHRSKMDKCWWLCVALPPCPGPTLATRGPRADWALVGALKLVSMSLSYRWRLGAQAAQQTWLKTKLTSRICTPSYHLHFARADALRTSLFDSVLHILSRTEKQVRWCWQGVFSSKCRCYLQRSHLLYMPSLCIWRNLDPI